MADNSKPWIGRQAWDALTDDNLRNMAKWNEQGGILHSNQAINSFTGIPEIAARMINGGQGLSKAWRDTFTEKTNKYINDVGEEVAKGTPGAKAVRKTRWGKLAGSVWAAGTALSAVGGAARGALTDKNGNFDIPGIPFI